MRYLVKAQLKPNKKRDLLQAIESGSLGNGSIAGHEYLHDMYHARQLENGLSCWVEVCFCLEPLQEELPYWSEYFTILEVKNAHRADRCKDLNGSEPWSCLTCDCTKQLESRLSDWGNSFIEMLREDPKNIKKRQQAI